MKKLVTLILALMVLFSTNTINAQGHYVKKYIETLKKDTLFTNAVIGIMVMDSKGHTVASWNPDMPLLTASTMKTISTGLILKTLGPDYRFTTRLGHSGYISGGVLYGDLYIIGGADPTLGSKDTVATPIEKVFEMWYDFLNRAGIKRINGSIVADDRFFEEENIHPSWSWSNLGPSFGSGTSGLSFCENSQYFKLIPGINPGDDVAISSVYPEVPDMMYRNRMTTSVPEKDEGCDYYISAMERVGEFRGTLPAGKDSVIVQVSNKFGPLACAMEFRKYLEKRGVLSTREIRYAPDMYEATPQDLLQVIGETVSPPLISIINVTNRISNNFYAETFFKMLGKTLTGTGSYDSARVAARRVLQDMGLSLRGYRQDDGSGLSRQNYVSTRFFCNFFFKMKEIDTFEEYFASFPQPGGPGTLQTVLKEVDPTKKTKIHAKSGSLSGVRCYAGYVERENGELWTFAILTNNYSVRTSSMQPGVEGFLKSMLK
jgi:D-alanyl-D-alanine carboxypeptidase/D-alanyl-D-alanine-endopeptidase (penicillin-binding protein 4)